MQRIVLAYTSFVVACLAVIAAFMTATNYAQLTMAIILYPVLIFFAYRMLPLRARKQFDETDDFAVETMSPIETNEETIPEAETPKKEGFGIADIDKRAFLKLIGGAGITLFLFSLFNKKGENLFLGNSTAPKDQVFLEDTAGNKINPAENQPTDGYTISEIEDDIIAYYGYTHKDGRWFIMKVDSDSGSFRYARGEQNFPSGWGSRSKLTYDYYNNVF